MNELCYIVRERRGGVHNAEFLALYMYFYVWLLLE